MASVVVISALPCIYSTSCPALYRLNLYVEYSCSLFFSVAGFIDRNKDALPPECQSLMRKSSMPLLQVIYTEGAGGAGLAGLTGMPANTTLTGGLLQAAAVTGSPEGGRVQRSSSSPGNVFNGVSSPTDDYYVSNGNNNSSSSGSKISRKGSRRQSFVNAETVASKFRVELEHLMMVSLECIRAHKPSNR